MPALPLTASYDDVAQAIVTAVAERGYTREQAMAILSTAIQESSLNPKAHNPAGWDGIFQQDGSYPGRFAADTQISGFLDRLDTKRQSPGWSSDIWKNIFWLQQRPSEVSGDAAYNNGRKAYLTEIQSHAAEAERLTNQYWKGTAVPSVKKPDYRPAYNEYGMWSPNNSSRGNTTVDAFFIHTQEGAGNADSLAKYLQGNNVSYHYTISEDPKDHGVTVVDVVDTDRAAWSVLDANSRSINLCYAGSSASWSRDDWMRQSKAVDVSAYIAAQDCVKYKIKPWVILPPYNGNLPGISDHRFVTKKLGVGNHTDVGGPLAPPWNGYPWDVFDTAFHKYYGKMTGVEAPPPLDAPVDVDLLQEVWDQLRGPGGKGWPQLGGRSLVDAVAELLRKG